MRWTSEQLKELLDKKKGPDDKKSKWNNVPTEVDGVMFPSEKEAERYVELKLMQRGGLIQDLKMQVSYDIHVNGILICRYVADFVYLKGQQKVVEDAKGKKLPLYILKKKLMLAVLGIKVREV